jgi:hypothetical protein
LIARRISWLRKRDGPEKIEEVVQIEGNLRYRITKALNAGVEETGDLGKIGDPGKREDLQKTGGLEGTGDLEKKGGGISRKSYNDP